MEIYDYNKRKQYLISVFNDTMHRINTDKFISDIVKKSINEQVFISHDEDIILPEKNVDTDVEIKVSKLRTMEAAAKYAYKYCTAVLNFASATTPGGGVKNGSSAQEECLNRVSTLLPCLDSAMPYEKFYNPHRQIKNPLHNNDIIYTRDVMVFKDDDYNMLDNPFYVDVITCAAPNLRENPSNKYNISDGEQVKIKDEELYELHRSRGRKILASAACNGVDVVVLGAFGCGVFQNPPEVVAQAYRDVVTEFNGYFNTIEFAVYCTPSKTKNYNAFKKILENF